MTRSRRITRSSRPWSARSRPSPTVCRRSASSPRCSASSTRWARSPSRPRCSATSSAAPSSVPSAACSSPTASSDRSPAPSRAWQAPYVDLVTAMMAFSLLLWLLNVTTDVQKRGIADYFEPTMSMKSESSGSGGILGGKAIGTPGALPRDSVAPNVALPIPAERQPDEGDDGEEAGAPSKQENPGDPHQAAKSQPADKSNSADFAARLDKIPEAT